MGAWSRIAGYLQLYIRPDRQAHAWPDQVPVQTGQGQIFPGRSGIDGVAFVLKLFDELERVQTDRTVRSTMELEIALPITIQASFAYLGFPNRQLRNTTVGQVDLMDMWVGRPGGHHQPSPSQDSGLKNFNAVQPSSTRRSKHANPRLENRSTISACCSTRMPEVIILARCNATLAK